MKTEYNPEQKGVSKTTGCIIAMAVLLFCFPLVIMFMDGLIHMYQDSPIRGKTIFIGIILCIICHATIIILKTVKLHKVVDNWTAIRKHVKVIDFKFANKNGGEDETTHGYYVITSDGENNYKGMFHRGAKIYGKSEEDLINDEFYREEGITLNLTNKDITRQQLDQKISSLEAEGEYANFFKKGKLFLEIEKMKKRKHDLEPYHLHTYEGDFYIGDEYVLLVDPDDSNNYIFEKDNV